MYNPPSGAKPVSMAFVKSTGSAWSRVETYLTGVRLGASQENLRRHPRRWKMTELELVSSMCGFLGVDARER